jgi:prepilin-type N-terminal cleavage/methylation domain-containing protein
MSGIVIANSSFATTSRARLGRGFTLIEAMMVTVIIGVGVMAMLQLLAAGTMVNGDSTERTTAVHLVNSFNEKVMRTPYASLRTLGTSVPRSYNPPVDGMNRVLNEYSDWTQVVTVRYVNPDNVKFTVPDSQVEPTSQVTVKILRNGTQVYQSSWIVTGS